MEVKSDAAMDLVLSEVDSPLYTHDRNDSLLQRSLAHMVGQFSTSRSVRLKENFGSFRTRRPSSAWKELSASNREWLSTQFSDPDNRTGMMQLSIILREDSGLSKLWKTPSWPLAKNAARELFVFVLLHMTYLRRSYPMIYQDISLTFQ